MTEPLSELTDLSEEQLAADPRIGMRRLTFEFLLQQEYFGTAAMMVAEYIAHIHRLEAAESSGIGVTQVKFSQKRQPFQMFKASIADVGVSKVKLPKARQSFQILKASTSDSGAGEVKCVKTRQASVAALVNTQSVEAADAEMKRRAVMGN